MVTETVPPPVRERVRTFLMGYGRRRSKPPASSLRLYEKIEKDYAVALALAILKAPIISAEWSIVVDESEELTASEECPGEESRQSSLAQPINGPTGQPINRSTGQPVNESTDQPINQSTPSDDIAKTLDKMLRPIWRSTVKHMLSAISRKSAPFEKIFEVRNYHGKEITWLKKLKPVQLRDAELLAREQKTPDGQIEISFGGMKVKQRRFLDSGETSLGDATGSVEVPWWKTFWFALDSDDGELVGESRLENVKRSWWDKNDEDGALDVETMWFRKYVYEGIEVWYPEGTTQPVVAGSTPKDNSDLAMRIGENILAGGVAAIPVADGTDPDKNPWRVKRAGEQKKSDEVSKWIDDRLDNRIFRGLFVAPTVAGGSQTGSGALGLATLGSVQFDVFLQTVEDMLHQCLDWLSRYVLQQLVQWNWGSAYTVRIESPGLASEAKDLLSKLLQTIFAGQNAGKILKLLDLVAVMEQAGLPLAKDADEVLAEMREQLGQSMPANPSVSGQLFPTDNGQRTDQAAMDGRFVRQSADRTAADLIDESSAAAISFWDSVRRDLKKKRIEAALGTN